MNQNMPKTRLEFLMRLTKVTGKTLSSSLHVDMSLVSRWKSGLRSLSNNGDQLEKICDFFISGNEGAYLSVVNQITEAQYSLELLAKDKESYMLLKKNLANWLLQAMKMDEYLLYEQQESINDSEKFYISFKGNEGKRRAVLALLENAIMTKQPHRFLIMDQENEDWLREDELFFNNWKNKMLEILNQGHQLIIIRRFSQQLDEIFKEIVGWIPIYLTGQVSVYAQPNIENTEYRQSFCVIEESYVLTGFSIDNNPDDRFTAFTNDKLTIQSHQNLFEKSLHRCTPLIRVFDKYNFQTVAETIIKAGKNNDNSYFMSDELFFSNMSFELLEDILKENCCNSDEEERALRFHHQLNKNFGQNVLIFQNHHIYNYQSLEKCAKQLSYQSSHLSIITGRPIHLTRNHFARHIEGTIDRLNNNMDFEVALTTCNPKTIMLQDLDIWIKDGHFLCTWSNKTYEHIMISIEPSVTHVFTEYYQQLWKSIPFIERDKEAVIRKFSKLLKLTRRLEVLEEHKN